MKKGNQQPDQEQLLKEITKLLQKFQIPYMVTGALSVIFMEDLVPLVMLILLSK
ncbi:MAG: hypothetical protein UR81_C0017G0004 [Candidatus Levybacteria bacterium GW2011_GWB1_35_5]|nr:MAG: hypothetical protein UR81_C0017G0004 [Candidatus Levybacteria bacterium GW2011_GWB1_35_5]